MTFSMFTQVQINYWFKICLNLKINNNKIIHNEANSVLFKENDDTVIKRRECDFIKKKLLLSLIYILLGSHCLTGKSSLFK